MKNNDNSIWWILAIVLGVAFSFCSIMSDKSPDGDWMVLAASFGSVLLLEGVCALIYKFWLWSKTSYLSLIVGSAFFFIILGLILYLCGLMYIDGSCVEISCSSLCQNKCVKGISLTTYIMATATLSTAIVALFKDKFERWIDCPRLIIRETLKDEEDKNGKKCFIHRIVVENIGRIPAQNLQVLLERKDGNDHAPFELRWSFYKKGEFEPIKLHPNLKRMWDLCGKPYDGKKLFIGADSESDAIRELDEGEYEFRLFAVADNLNTIEKTLKIKYGDSDEQVSVQIL